jgi:hypothetical protein
VNYLLRLSEENKDLDKIVRALMDRRIKEMCDELKKLQVSEDKPAALNLKYYWLMDGRTQRHVCEDAVRANPDVVKQLQSIAKRYVKQIQSELAALTKSHPCLAGIGQARIELPSANETEKILCGLSFEKSTHMVEVPSGGYQEPDKDGCVLIVWVHNILASYPPDRRDNFSDQFLVHEIEMRAYYFLRLSEENKELNTTVRALLDQRVKEMCDELKKLQTTEDKKAGDEF